MEYRGQSVSAGGGPPAGYLHREEGLPKVRLQTPSPVWAMSSKAEGFRVADCMLRLYICMHECMHAIMDACMHVFTYATYVRTYVCMYACR